MQAIAVGCASVLTSDAMQRSGYPSWFGQDATELPRARLPRNFRCGTETGIKPHKLYGRR
jgi:hypothetical protein